VTPEIWPARKNLFAQWKSLQPSADGDYGVYALDCEMCYTTGGGELTRIAVISTDYKTVYETLVMSDNPILDYNTRFSGITEEDLVDVKTTLKDVQAFLLNLLSSNTILIGHGLRALGVVIMAILLVFCFLILFSY
jgi:RNA exonuclease 1